MANDTNVKVSDKDTTITALASIRNAIRDNDRYLDPANLALPVDEREGTPTENTIATLRTVLTGKVFNSGHTRFASANDEMAAWLNQGKDLIGYELTIKADGTESRKTKFPDFLKAKPTIQAWVSRGITMVKTFEDNYLDGLKKQPPFIDSGTFLADGKTTILEGTVDAMMAGYGKYSTEDRVLIARWCAYFAYVTRDLALDKAQTDATDAGSDDAATEQVA